MKYCPTITATICVGLRVAYSEKVRTITQLQAVCQTYCNEVGLGLTVTPTTFIYTEGWEPGALVGMINYPRFPSTQTEIRMHAFSLANRLMDVFEQQRVSVVFQDETFMLESNQEGTNDRRADQEHLYLPPANGGSTGTLRAAAHGG